jgi:hypothetical protein
MEGWENDMEQSTRAGVRAIVLAVTVLFVLPLQAQAERDWEFSVGGFGGKAFNSNEDVKFNFGQGSGFTTGTAHGVNLNDSSAFGAKITAWYLPRQYKWQPQIGLELDYKRLPQISTHRQPEPVVPLSHLVCNSDLSPSARPKISA